MIECRGTGQHFMLYAVLNIEWMSNECRNLAASLLYAVYYVYSISVVCCIEPLMNVMGLGSISVFAVLNIE